VTSSRKWTGALTCENLRQDHEWFRTQDETFSVLVEQLSDRIPDMTHAAFPDGVPEAGACPKACIADGWHEESLHARTRGRHGSMTKALDYYQRAVLLAPDNAAANHHLGAAVWQEKRDADLAGKLLGRAVQLNPMSLTALHAFHQVALEVLADEEGGQGRQAAVCNATVHEKARFREVLTWVEARIAEVTVAVEKACDEEMAQENSYDVPGEGFCRTILRRAIDQTMRDISEGIPAAPQSLQELVRTGGGRERDDDELRGMLDGSSGFNSVDEREKTKVGREQVDAIFRWAAPDLKEALIAKRREKHATARARRAAQRQDDEVLKPAFSVEMDRDREKIASFLEVDEFDNMWTGEEGEGEGDWNEEKERERLRSPLQEAIQELLREAEHDEGARAQVEDINEMMRDIASKHNATRAAQQILKNFAVRMGFADMFTHAMDPVTMEPVIQSGAGVWGGLLGDDVDLSQWSDDKVPILSDLEALRVSLGNRSLAGIDRAMQDVGKEGDLALQTGATHDDEAMDLDGPRVMEWVDDGEDPRTLYRGNAQRGEQEPVLLKDRLIELGLHVRVQGLEKGVQYNGLAGQVIGYNDETGRVQVCLNLSLNHTNLQASGLDEVLNLRPEKLVVLDDLPEGFDALMKMKFPWVEAPGTGPDTYGGPGYWAFLLSSRTSIELKEWGERLVELGEGNFSDVTMYLAERANDRFVNALGSGNWATQSWGDVMRKLSFRDGGENRWGVERRRRRRKRKEAAREGRLYEEPHGGKGEDEEEVRDEQEEEEAMAYESLLCGPEGDGAHLDDDDTKRKIQEAKSRRAEEDDDDEVEDDDEWGGARWVGKEVPTCGQVDPEYPGLSEADLDRLLRGDGSADALCGWQKDLVIQTLKHLFVQDQKQASAAYEADWDEGIPNPDVSKYAVDENPTLLADCQMVAIQRCMGETREVVPVDANTTDPEQWGELGPQVGGFLLTYVNKTYHQGTSFFGRSAADEAVGHPPYRSKREMDEMYEEILEGLDDARMHEIIINHFAALAATATAAHCSSIPEWVDLRGGEELLRAEIAKDLEEPGSSTVLMAVEEEILRATLSEIAEAQKQYTRNEPCSGSVPQPNGLASTVELLRGEHIFRAHTHWVGVSHWWPRTICSRPEWGLNANAVDAVAGMIRAMHMWGRRWGQEPSAGGEEEGKVDGLGEVKGWGRDADWAVPKDDTGDYGTGDDGGENIWGGGGGLREGEAGGRGEGARRGRRSGGISRSRETQSPALLCRSDRGDTECGLGLQLRGGGEGDADAQVPYVPDAEQDVQESNEYVLEDEAEVVRAHAIKRQQEAEREARRAGLQQERDEVGKQVEGEASSACAAASASADTHKTQHNASAVAGPAETKGAGAAEERGLDEGQKDSQKDEMYPDPPHYGTEDESSEPARRRWPERFRPFAKQLRSLVIRPPRDWKYQVELDDDSNEKGEIQRATAELEEYKATAGNSPGEAGSSHEADKALQELIAAKALAISSSLRRRNYFLPAWQVIEKAFSKAPSHPLLLASHIRLLNFEVYERDRGQKILQHALAVAPAHPDVLV
jgi:hypothetical protein